MEQKIYKITIGDKTYEFTDDMRYQDVAERFQDQYEDDIVLVQIGHCLRELNKKVDRDGELTFVTTGDPLGRKAYRRSVTFLMNKAMHNLNPEHSVVVLHSIGQGYYCDVRGMEKLDETFLCKLKEEMLRLVDEDIRIKKTSMNSEDAVTMFRERGMHDKERLLRYRCSSQVNIYWLEDYANYYYGSMVPSTGYLKYFDLIPYENGFMLMFPGKDTKKAAEFAPLDKFFAVLHGGADWGRRLGVPAIGALDDAIAQGRAQSLVLVQEGLMEKKIAQIAETIAEQPDKKFIMIAGPSSSGKTTFSHRLSIQLIAQGKTPHPIALDDYYVNREDTPKDEYGELDFECLEAVDVEQFNSDMTRLLAGEEVLMPTFNFKTGHREYRGNKLKLGEDDILVIEGIHGLNDRLSYKLPTSSKFKIYISALTPLNIDEHNVLPTTDARLIRRLVRDARTRATSARDTIARWPSVRRGEEKNIFPYQEGADVMFNSALIYELPVLKCYAEPLLFSIDKDCPEYLEAKRLLKFLDYVLPIPAEHINNNSILREFIGGSCFNV